MFLALREIARSRARFALLGGAVGLLVVLLLFFQSVAGALTGALTGSLANQTADVVVYGDRARQNPAASVLAPEAVDAVDAVDGVAEAAGVVQAFSTVTGPDGDEADAVVVGIEPGAPGTPSEVDGELPGDGQALASGSGFDRGYPTGSTVTLEPGGIALDVVGEAVDAAANASPTLYVTLPTFRQLAAARTGGSADGAPAGGTPVSWVGVTPADGVDATTLAHSKTWSAGRSVLRRDGTTRRLSTGPHGSVGDGVERSLQTTTLFRKSPTQLATVFHEHRVRSLDLVEGSLFRVALRDSHPLHQGS